LKIWLIRLTTGFFALILLLLSLSLFLLGTETGTRWLAERATALTREALQVEKLRGHLLGRLELGELSYQTPDMRIRMEKLLLSWAPRELFNGLLHFRNLEVVGLQYEQLRESSKHGEPDQPDKDKPAFSNDIELPLDLLIDQLQVEDVKLITAVDADPVTIESLLLQAGWNERGISLETVQLAMPEFIFRGEGKLQPKGKYPMAIATDVQLVGVDLPTVKIRGQIAGDLEALVVTQKIAGDITAALDARVKNVTSNLSWNADLGITRLSGDKIPSTVPADLAIKLEASGNTQKAKAAISLKTAKSADTDLNLNADIQFATLGFEVIGNWQQIQWPLSGFPLVLAEQGELQLSGSPDNYELSLQSKVQGQDIPPGSWSIVAKGNTEQLVAEQIHGELLDGSIDVQGETAWSPATTWKAEVTLKAIDPGVFYPEWPGNINLSATTVGELIEEKLQAQVLLKQFGGVLRQQPLSGGGSVRIDGPLVQIDNFNLNSGQANIQVQGNIDEMMDIHWKMQVPDLTDLLAQASGSVRGEGRINGATDAAVIAGEIQLAAIAVGTTELQSANTDFSISMDSAHRSRFKLHADNLDLNGQHLPGLDISVNGPVNAHNIQVDVIHQQLELKLAAQGGYLIEQGSWQGELQQLQLLDEITGEWNLQQKTKLNLGPSAIKLSSLCLENEPAALCTEADWADKTGTALVNLKAFNLERIKPLLSPEFTELDGLLGFDLQLENKQSLQASLDVDIQPGLISIQADPEHQIQLHHKNAHLKARYDQQELSADWNLNVEEHLAKGAFTIPRKALEENPQTAPVSGSIKLAVQDLGLIKAFTPQIEEFSGNIQADLNLGGSLGNPRIRGEATLNSEQLTIPMIGLNMTELQLKASSDGSDTLDLIGAAASGGGTMNLDGELTLDADLGWPMQLQLKADHFQAANLPEAQLLLNSEISLERSNALNKVRGRLEIPQANIEFNEIPEGSQSLSADVVIVDEGGEMPDMQTDTLDLNLTVVLGDKVRFGGMGLKADLSGEITANVRPGKLPTANGDVTIKNGSFRAYGQNLRIEKGRVSYAGGYLDNPGIQLRASRIIDDVKVGVDVAGTAKKPEVTAFSDDPEISSSDAVSMLLTGKKLSDLSNAQIYAGRQITPDLSVGVNLGAGNTATEFVARYRLRDNVHAEGTSSSEKSGATLMYSIEVK